MGHSHIRTVVVDDSRLMRTMMNRMLQEEGDIEVVGLAQDTVEGRRLIKELSPDVVTLDVEMPGMNGIDFLEKIMTLRPMPVIMVSSLTANGSDTALAALQIGAVDAVAKPDGINGRAQFAAHLRDKVRMAARAHVQISSRNPVMARPRPIERPALSAVRQIGGTNLIAIGASTGGVGALSTVLTDLPPDLPPIVITQHMPDNYIARFAERLNNTLPFDVAEARSDEALSRGMVRIAPGGHHLLVRPLPGGRVRTFLRAEPADVQHRPSVDVMFQSAAGLGRQVLGVILTGMGRDGAEGLLAMRRAGAMTLGQDEQSSVVYGMPKAAAECGAVTETCSLTKVAPRICTLLQPIAPKHVLNS